MVLPHIIALDGPAGAGKTSVAAAVAAQLGYLFVDTGAFYRAVTLAAFRAGVVEAEESAIIAVSRAANLDVAPGDSEGPYRVLLDGEDITTALSDGEVEKYVSRVAAIPGVRDVLNEKYRALARTDRRVIMAGRDIGTVVLPDADLKIYLDASLDVRAERRFLQASAGGRQVDLSGTRQSLAGRDKLDSERAVAPLRAADDAYHVNTDALDVAQVIARVIEIVRGWDTARAGH